MKHLKYAVVLMAVLLAFTACKNSKNGGSSNAKMASDFALELEHVGCRGNCPAYTIKVDAKGNASYEGRRAVDMMGMYTKTLDPTTVKAMSKAVSDANFFDFDDAYGAEVADVPGIRTTVTLNGQTKTVNDVRNAPKELKDLEAKLEGMVGVQGWKKAE